MDNVSLSGIIDILAHSIRLIRQIDGEMQVQNIEEIFVSVEAIRTLASRLVTIAPGQSYTEYYWPPPITDQQIPGLASLIQFLDSTYRRSDDDSIINRYYTVNKTLKNQFLNSDVNFYKQNRIVNNINNYISQYETTQRIVNKKLAIENHDSITHTKKVYNTTNNISKHFSYENSSSFVKRITDRRTLNTTNNITNHKKTFLIDQNLNLTQRLTKNISQHTTKKYDQMFRNDTTINQIARTVNQSHKHVHERIQKDDYHTFHKTVNNKYQTIKRIPVWTQIDQHFSFTRTGLTQLTWSSIIGAPQLYDTSQVDALLLLKMDVSVVQQLLALKRDISDSYSVAQIDAQNATQNANIANAQTDIVNLQSSVGAKRNISDSYAISQIDAQNAVQDANIANLQTLVATKADAATTQSDIINLQALITSLQVQINNLTNTVNSNYSTFTSTINLLQSWNQTQDNTIGSLFNTQVKISTNYFTPRVIEFSGSGLYSGIYNNNTQVLTLTHQ